MITTIFLTLLGFATEQEYRLKVNPFDFQDEANPDSFITGIRQIECNGEDLFILSHDEPSVFQISGKGKFLKKIGSKGGGPKELGYHGPVAMAVQGNSLWIIDDRHKAAHFFEGGEHQLRIPIATYQLRYGSNPTDVFAFTNNHVLIQAHPTSQHLAAI